MDKNFFINMLNDYDHTQELLKKLKEKYKIEIYKTQNVMKIYDDAANEIEVVQMEPLLNFYKNLYAYCWTWGKKSNNLYAKNILMNAIETPPKNFFLKNKLFRWRFQATEKEIDVLYAYILKLFGNNHFIIKEDSENDEIEIYICKINIDKLL